MKISKKRNKIKGQGKLGSSVKGVTSKGLFLKINFRPWQIQRKI